LNELGVSSKEIENVIDVISKYNVIGKLTGAGGGGCVIGFSKGD
jgi:mevalonate kinase